jgi:hypothetical protein
MPPAEAMYAQFVFHRSARLDAEQRDASQVALLNQKL